MNLTWRVEPDVRCESRAPVSFVMAAPRLGTAGDFGLSTFLDQER